MTVRAATSEDLDTIVDLCEAKRQQYQSWQPVFHRKAEDSAERHRYFLSNVINSEGKMLLVFDREGVQGALFAVLGDAPPVYDPGGKVCMVDDFVVAAPDQWEEIGGAMLEEVISISKQLGCVLVNVVCGPNDKPKQQFLAKRGYSVASEWRIKELV